MATITVGGQVLMLLPEKCVLLPESDTLLVADAHIGKAASFQALGVPVPSGTTGATLALLGALVRRLAVRRIVFLGDFLHSARSHGPATLAAVKQWRNAHAGLELTLVRGNHNDRADDPPGHLGIETVDEPLRLGGLALCHHPRPQADAYVLAGHLHPGISVSGRAHDSLRLPCYWFSPRLGVLPAFGAFTGMQTIAAAPGERVFAVTPERVFELGRMTVPG
jgi:DNA ligase-associated metallophosphoesterase